MAHFGEASSEPIKCQRWINFKQNHFPKVEIYTCRTLIGSLLFKSTKHSNERQMCDIIHQKMNTKAVSEMPNNKSEEYKKLKAWSKNN